MQNKKITLGFTLIEIIITIVILGILTAVTISRFSTGNAFNAIIVRDQIISLSRIAQQHSLGRADVSLKLTPNGADDELTIETSDDTGVIDTVVVAMDTVALSGDVDETDGCASTSATDIDSANPMTIAFGELGDLDDSGIGTLTAVTSAVRICINDTANESVCISPSGFAYAGDCDA